MTPAIMAPQPQNCGACLGLGGGCPRCRVAPALPPVVPAPAKLKKPAPVDFGGPQQPPTAYTLFSVTVRDACAKEVRAGLSDHRDFRIADVSKAMGDKWAQTPEAEKARFHQSVAALKAKYELDLQAWRSTDGYKSFVNASAAFLQQKKAARKASKAVPTGRRHKEKRPLNAYFRFAAEVKAAVAEEVVAVGKGSTKERSALTKAKWDALGAEGQQPYHEAAKKELEAWMAREAAARASAHTGDDKSEVAAPPVAQEPTALASGPNKRKAVDLEVGDGRPSAKRRATRSSM